MIYTDDNDNFVRVRKNIEKNWDYVNHKVKTENEELESKLEKRLERRVSIYKELTNTKDLSLRKKYQNKLKELNKIRLTGDIYSVGKLVDLLEHDDVSHDTKMRTIQLCSNIHDIYGFEMMFAVNAQQYAKDTYKQLVNVTKNELNSKLDEISDLFKKLSGEWSVKVDTLEFDKSSESKLIVDTPQEVYNDHLDDKMIPIVKIELKEKLDTISKELESKKVELFSTHWKLDEDTLRCMEIRLNLTQGLLHYPTCIMDSLGNLLRFPSIVKLQGIRDYLKGKRDEIASMIEDVNREIETLSDIKHIEVINNKLKSLSLKKEI